MKKTEAELRITSALNALDEIFNHAWKAKEDAKGHAKRIKKATKAFGKALDELFTEEDVIKPREEKTK